MKTIDLEEIKKQVVKKYAYTKPYVSLTLDDKAMLSDEIAIEYARQCCDEQKQVIADKFIKDCKSKPLSDTLYK